MSSVTRVENLTDKPITEFVAGDTIYITKMKSGSQILHLCRFVSYEKGIVTGDVTAFEPSWAYHAVDACRGIRIRARLAKCFLWGRSPGDKMDWPHCHWFDSKTKCVKSAGETC